MKPGGAQGLLARAWNSPTITTWASFAGRSLSLLLVLPLVLRHFGAPEVAAWQLFSNVILIGLVLDAGLSPTLSRLISLKLGAGAVTAPPAEEKASVRWEEIAELVRAGRTLYAVLAILVFVIIGGGGALALVEPLARVADIQSAWAAAFVVLVTTAIAVWNNLYVSYLTGIEKVAVLRRAEAVFSVGQVFTAALVVSSGGGLLSLVVANQAWVIANVVRNHLLCRNALPGRFATGWSGRIPRHVWDLMWPPMWRSGLGIFMSQGVVYASGFIYAQWMDPVQLAAFLLAQRIMLAISQFSQAPFYANLPGFTRKYAANSRAELLNAAQKAMRSSYWVLVVGTVAVALLAAPALHFVGAKIAFVSPGFWALYAVAVFVERLGAMHMQLYSLTNRILWHVANGVTGVVMLVILMALYPRFGMVAFPVGMLVAYACIYSWFSIRNSLRHFSLRFFEFEFKASFGPAVALALGLAASLMLGDRG